METLGFIASKLVDAFVVAGVAWPFIPQARSILRTGDANAYSLLTSLVVIVSATLRCFFWLNDRFETTLLVQAVVAILAHLAMIYVVVFVKQRNRAANPTGKPLKTLSDLDWQQFWGWDDWESYAQVEMLLVMALMAAQVLFAGPAYSQVLGTLSLGIEAMLPLPQAVKNFQNKSTQGVSSVMIVAWLAGASPALRCAATAGHHKHMRTHPLAASPPVPRLASQATSSRRFTRCRRPRLLSSLPAASSSWRWMSCSHCSCTCSTRRPTTRRWAPRCRWAPQPQGPPPSRRTMTAARRPPR